jgi:hypothetical protein
MIDSHASLLHSVCILDCTTAHHSRSSRCRSDVQKMLVSKRREPAVHPKSPAGVVFDFFVFDQFASRYPY